MKILVVVIPTGKENSPEGEFYKSFYIPMTKRNINLVKNPDTELVFRVCEWGMGGVEVVAFYRYLDHLASRMVYYSALHAKEEGFDAVIIDCFGDPMLWEVRQALDIPVIGLKESAFGTACMMGYKFGIVHISPSNIPETEEHLVKYGYAEKCVGMEPSATWGVAPTLDSRTIIDGFLPAAKKLVAAGAEVIIPGCSIISPWVRLAVNAEDEYPNGITEVDGAAVFDLVGNAVKCAETLAALRKGGSSWISRKNLYIQPPQEVLDLARPILDDGSFQFWDIT